MAVTEEFQKKQLLKSSPSDPLSPNPETNLLLNFNRDTCVGFIPLCAGRRYFRHSAICRRKVSMHRWTGNSSSGYEMMTKSADQSLQCLK